MGKKVYVLENHVEYEGTQVMATYSNEDSALRALAGRFNLYFNMYIGTDDLPEWGCREESSFYVRDESYHVVETDVLD